MSQDPTSIAAPSVSANMEARLPNFCNLGIMLRMLLILNALVLAAAVVRTDAAHGLWQQFLAISVLAQPAIILSLLVSCLAQPILAKLQYWRGVLAIFVFEALLGYGLWQVLPILSPYEQNPAWWQFALLIFFATAIVLFYFHMRSRALSPALTEARLQALQARIRPHFLFNSINAVLSLIRSEPKRAERMLEDMSELFRVLMADNRQLTPLADEVELCRRYLEIEQTRLGDRLQVVWRIADMPGETLVPPLFLQPLIENAVYHGVEPNPGAGPLEIDISRKDSQVLIRLTNPYHAGGNHVSGNRMALDNIKERLQLHFDAEARLTSDITGAQYLVTITMPLSKK